MLPLHDVNLVEIYFIYHQILIQHTQYDMQINSRIETKASSSPQSTCAVCRDII